MIDEEQAQIVQNIFDLYLNEYSVIAIIRELETLGIKSPTGKDRWSKRAIENMLINKKYIGNVLVSKTYSKEFPNNKRLLNKNESAKYLAEGSHPAIISKEKFDRVQAEKERRSRTIRSLFSRQSLQVFGIKPINSSSIWV